MKISVGARTDVGRVRQLNEDAAGYSEERRVFVVADGMGGHSAGEVASAMLVETVMKRFGELKAEKEKDIETLIVNTIQEANEAINEAARNDAEKKGMGCTAVVCGLSKKRFHVGWVGDSRLYLYRKGELAQVTRDHSQVQAMVDAGVITAEEAISHPRRNEITRAVGVNPKVQVEIAADKLKEGDILIMCTDGVHGEKTDDVLLKALAPFDSADGMADRLIGMANDMGGSDNATAIVIKIEDI